MRGEALPRSFPPALRRSSLGDDESGRVRAAFLDRPVAFAAGRLLVWYLPVAIAGLTVLGVVLRLVHLGSESLWLDEALSVAYARLEWTRFSHLVATRELNMLPYYLILREWVHFGTSESIVRGLSAVWSIATMPLMYVLGARLASQRVGLVALALTVLHPFAIAFAQEARSYSFLVFLVTLSTLCLVLAVRRPSRALWGAYVVASALAVYAHFYGSLAILAQWIALALARPRGVTWTRLAVVAALIVVLVSPVIAFVVLGRADPGGWMTRPSFGRVEYLLFLLLGAGNAPGERKFAVIAFGAALVGAARLTVRSLRGARRADARGADEDGGEHPWELVLIWSGALVPLLVVLAASVVRPTFVDKYLIESLPFVTLAVAVGVDGLHPRWLAHATLAAALALNVHAVLAYYARPTKDDWRGATRWVLTAARVGDAAAFVPSYSIAPFEYYRTRHARRMRQAHAGSDTLRPQVVFPGRFGRETSELTTALAAGRLSRESNRLWVVFNHDGAAGAALRDTLAQRYRVVDDEQFRGVRVVLYEVPQSGRHR